LNPILRLPDFRSYLAFKLLLTFALQMQAVVLGYHIYTQTHDPLALGFIGLAEAGPALFVALYAGYLADRREKRKMLRQIVLVMAFISSLIFLVNLPQVHFAMSDQVYLFSLYGLIAAGGFARGFYSPTSFSLMSLLVPRENYPSSSAYNSMVWQIATVCGPTLGGFLYAWGGPSLAFGLVVLLIIGGFICLTLIEQRVPPSPDFQVSSVFSSIREGWQFVFSKPLLIGSISVDLLSVFFGGAVALLPIYAADILHVGPQGLGMLRGADALGSVATMILLTRYPPTKDAWRNLLGAVAAFGLCIIGFGLSTSFALSLLFLFLLGSADSISVVIRSTLIQQLTPEHMRGRVASVNTVFIASSNEIGAFESGFTARWFGTVPATLIGGCITLSVAATAWIVSRKSKFDLKQIPT
jgi:MFS family permease